MQVVTCMVTIPAVKLSRKRQEVYDAQAGLDKAVEKIRIGKASAQDGMQISP